MMEEPKPIGQLYSRVYLPPTQTSRDSIKMRRRVLRTILRIVPERLRDTNFGDLAEELLGIEMVTADGFYGSYVNWDDVVLRSLPIAELLSTLTLLWRRLPEHGDQRTEFRDCVAGIFADEAIGFSLDQKMGFHPALDEEFERSLSSVIRILNSKSFRHEADFIAKSETALLADPIDGREAVRAVYDATENLFKRITKKQNITNGNVRKELSLIALAGVPTDGKSNVAVNKMLDAFEDWVAACHVYRHAPGEAEATQPSSEIAILMVSQGYAFVRWLAEIVKRQGDGLGI